MELEHILDLIIPYLAAVLEAVGILIILYASIKTLIKLAKAKFDLNNEGIKIDFAKALAFSLEFKLAAEIMKTVVVHDFDEFVVLAAVIVLRVILTFVIQWEINNGEKAQEGSIGKREK